jgi:hypothetical protein
MPFAAPAWLTPARIAVITVVIGGAVASVPATALTLALLRAIAGAWRLESWDPTATLAVPMILSTALLSFRFARRLLANPFPGSPRCALQWGAYYGVLNPLVASGPLCFFLLEMRDISIPNFFLCVIFCLIASLLLSPAGLILGLVFGAAYHVPLRAAVRAREQPAHDDAERTLAACGGWLAVLSLTFGAMPFPDWFRAGALSTALVGIACLAIGTAFSRRRHGWLRAVARGKIAGWTIDALARERELASLLPFYRRRDRDYSALLVTHDGSEAAPYRTKGSTPVALVSPVDA